VKRERREEQGIGGERKRRESLEQEERERERERERYGLEEGEERELGPL
jgi:hypothetical protein